MSKQFNLVFSKIRERCPGSFTDECGLAQLHNINSKHALRSHAFVCCSFITQSSEQLTDCCAERGRFRRKISGSAATGCHAEDTRILTTSLKTVDILLAAFI